MKQTERTNGKEQAEVGCGETGAPSSVGGNVNGVAAEECGGSSKRKQNRQVPAAPWCSDSKESARSAGDRGSIPGLGRSPGEGNGNPLWYSCLENLMNRGAWQAAVHGVSKSWTRLSD